MKKLLTVIGLTVLTLSAFSQPANQGFFGTVSDYFTSFNTNLDSTFSSERGTVWTGVDSIQGGRVAMANQLGLSYDLWKMVSVENVLRNSGVGGTLVSEQVGFGLNFPVHDVKLTVYAHAGYEFLDSGTWKDKLYGEVGLRVSKALTQHTFAGVGLGTQFPSNKQVFSALVGFTF